MMNQFGEGMNRLMQTMNGQFVPEEGDYQQDGVWFCGKCETPRQKYYEGIGMKFLLCVCREAEENLKEERKERERLAGKIADRKLIRYRFHDDDGKYDLTRFVRYTLDWKRNKEENCGLMLTGRVGVGKSFVASCIANAVLDRLERVVFFGMWEVQELFSSYRADEAEKERYFYLMKTAPLVIIDEFSIENANTHFLENCFQLIEARCNAQLPLILTTNTSFQQMKNEKDILKSKIYDRLFQMCVPIVLEGGSRRVGMAMERMKKWQDG